MASALRLCRTVDSAVGRPNQPGQVAAYFSCSGLPMIPVDPAETAKNSLPHAGRISVPVDAGTVCLLRFTLPARCFGVDRYWTGVPSP